MNFVGDLSTGTLKEMPLTIFGIIDGRHIIVSGPCGFLYLRAIGEVTQLYFGLISLSVLNILLRMFCNHMRKLKNKIVTVTKLVTIVTTELRNTELFASYMKPFK
jgi:hypothetical protein